MVVRCRVVSLLFVVCANCGCVLVCVDVRWCLFLVCWLLVVAVVDVSCLFIVGCAVACCFRLLLLLVIVRCVLFVVVC